jgi:hypothetical protein
MMIAKMRIPRIRCPAVLNPSLGGMNAIEKSDANATTNQKTLALV